VAITGTKTARAWFLVPDVTIPIPVPTPCPTALEAAVLALDITVREAANAEGGAALATYLRNQATACLAAWRAGELGEASAAEVLKTLARRAQRSSVEPTSRGGAS
jgi:hypothetical protein